MPLPIPNLDNKTFEQLVEEAKKLIPVYAPEWTDHNLHDPGITLIELFAWLSEIQLYSLNRIDEEKYLKYLKLLGITPDLVQSARVDITFLDDIGYIPAGSRFVAQDPRTEESVIFETDTDIELSKIKLEKLIVYSDYHYRNMSDFNRANKNFFYAFGDKPVTGNSFYLGFSGYNNKKLNLKFCLYEDDLPELGGHGDEHIEYSQILPDSKEYWVRNNNELNRFFPSATLRWQYWDKAKMWKDLDTVNDKTIHFSTDGQVGFGSITNVEAAIPDNLIGTIEQPFGLWLKCEIIEGNYEIAPRIERILLNTISATQHETHKQSLLGVSTGLPGQIFSLNNKKALIANSLEIEIDNGKWEEIDDILLASPNTKYFQVNYQKNTVIFGDDLNGKIPPAEHEIKVNYRVSDGDEGNIGALAINQNELGLTAVNYFPAKYGKNIEKLLDTIIRMKKDILVPYMAVTLRDYEKITIMTPGLRVARAKAIPDTAKNKVSIVVVPYSFTDTPQPSDNFIKTVCHHVDKHRTITTSIDIQRPMYVKVSVSAKITLSDRSNPDKVRVRCIEKLRQFLSPIKRREGDNEWEFGRDVYKSDIYSILESVDGVDGVIRLSLMASDGGSLDNEGDIIIGDEYLVYSGEHQVEIVAKSIC